MRIVSLQYLRGFAALLVVLSHNVFLLGEGWIKHIPGLLGVDIFFIISGSISFFVFGLVRACRQAGPCFTSSVW